MLGKIKASPPISWDWLEMSCCVQSFTETSCEDSCSIFRKEGRQKTKRKGIRERGGKEERGEERREEAWVLPAWHTGNTPSQKSLPWTKGTVAIWWQLP